MKGGLNLGNAFVFASANHSTRKIKMYKTTFFVIVLYGCDTWSFSLRKEHKTRDVWGQDCEENLRTWEGIIRRRLEKITVWGASLFLRPCPVQYYTRDKIEDGVGGACGTCGGEAKCTQGFGGEIRDHMEDIGISETMIRKSTLQK